MSESALPEPELSAQAALEITRAFNQLEALWYGVMTSQRQTEWHEMPEVRAVVYDADSEAPFLGSVNDWDGQFLSFAALRAQTGRDPNAKIYIDFAPSSHAETLTFPGVVRHASFFAQALKGDKAAPETVIRKELGISAEGTSQVREGVADPSRPLGIRMSEWRAATEAEGQAILADFATMQERTEEYLAANPGPITDL